MFIGKKVVHKGKVYNQYFATEEGFVYSLQEKGGKVTLNKIGTKGSNGNDGKKRKYPTVNIGGKTIDTHSIIAETFFGDPTNVRPRSITESEWKRTPASVKQLIRNNAIHVDHINGDITDNRVSNLQYMLANDNIKKGGVARR